MYKTVTPCFSTKSAPYYICRSIPVLMEEPQATASRQVATCPNVFVQYGVVSMLPHDFLQSCFTTEIEAAFQLHPHHSLQVDYTPKDLYCYVCHILLPEQPTGNIVFFASEFFWLEFGATDTSTVSLVSGKNVKSIKTSSETVETHGAPSRISFTVDVNKVVTIRYGMMDDKKISLMVNASQVNVYLEKAIPNVPDHLKSVCLVNQPSDPRVACCIGVLGIFLYSFTSCESWKNVPSDAAILSTMGSHFGKEEGARKYTYSNAQYRLVLKKEGKGSYVDPWRFFLHSDDRVCDKNCMASRNQFVYSNESCYFNFNVQFDYEKHRLTLGNSSKFGSLYWKYAFPLPKFQISMDVTLAEPGSYVMLWFSGVSVPSYVYLSQIQRDFIGFVSDANPKFSNCYYTKLQMDQPIMSVILYRSQQGVMLYYTRSYYDTDYGRYFVFLLKNTTPEMATSGTLACEIGDSAIEIKFGSTDFCIQSFNIRRYFACDVLISGLIGSDATISSFTACSVFSDPEYSLLANSKNVVLPSLESSCYAVKRNAYIVAPCNISYRDFPLLANSDPLKRDPPTYKTSGYIAVRNDVSKWESFVISQDANEDKLLVFHFCDEDSAYNYIWRNDQGTLSPLKLVLESRKSNGSFSFNTRLSSSNCLSRGLYNFFNICFQNSTLQLLFHSDSLILSIANFYKLCAEREEVNQTNDFRVLQAIMECFTRLQFSWYNTEFNNVILTLKDRFEIGTQHVTNRLLFMDNE